MIPDTDAGVLSLETVQAEEIVEAAVLERKPQHDRRRTPLAQNLEDVPLLQVELA
jgi:hypothetical protein